MANEQNLIPFSKRTKSEQREIARKGGKASGEARKEKKLIKERILERMTENDWDEFIDNFIERAKNGDRAFELMRDTIGEKPVDQINITNVDKSLEEMEAFFKKQNE